MSLAKAVEHGHEHRKPYRRSKRFDRTCRNHGGCPRCEGDRTYAGRRAEVAARQDEHTAEEQMLCDGTCPLCWPEAWRWDDVAGRYEPQVLEETDKWSG